jgi:hypothetical protein
MAGIRVVTRADDCGSFRSANRAILDCCDKGVVRNVSVMVTAGVFSEAVAMFRDRTDICVGVHGTITCEWNEQRWRPVLPPEQVPSLVDSDGCFHQSVDSIMKAGVRFEQILAELGAQVDRARAAGLEISYIDNHMAFGWLFEGANDSYRLTHALDSWSRERGLLWHGWGSSLNLTRPQCGEGPAEQAPERFAAAIRTAAPGDYVMVTHPAYADGDIAGATYDAERPGAVATQRNTDRRVFMDPVVLDAFRDSGAQPIRYTDL